MADGFSTGPGDFIGHIAGDDFVRITSESRTDVLCRAIIEAFDRLASSKHASASA